MQPRNLLMYRPNATEAVSVSLQLCARSAKTSIKVSYNCTKQNMSKSPNNTNTNTNNNNSPAEVKAKIRKCLETPHCGVIRDQKWQGKLITKRWDDEDLRKGCLNCTSRCYQRDCTSQKIRTTSESEVLCRLYGKFPKSVPQVLAGCPALAQNRYLSRHIAALKILFFESLRDLKLADEVPPWYSLVKPKPV